MKRTLIILAVISVLSLVGYQAYRVWASRRGTETLEAKWQVINVGRGTIEATVNATGVIQAKRQMVLTFKTGGRIEEIAVEKGQTVRQGDILARLETDDIELQVRQAKVALEIAERRAALTKRGADPEDIAASEAALKAARENLARMKKGPDESQLAAAEAALKAAQENLARLKEGPSETQLAAAEAALKAARENLARLEEGPSKTQLAAAEASLKAAESSYEKVVTGPTADDLRRAKLAVDQAKNSLWGAQTSRDSLGFSVKMGSPRSQLDQAEAQVLNAEIAVELAEMNYRDLQEGAGKAEVQAALASLEKARDAYQSLKETPRSADLAAAESQVAQAEASLDQLKSSPSDAEIAAAESQVAQAEASLDQLKSGASAAEVSAAEAQIAQAEATLAKLRAGASEEEIAIAEAQVEQARLSLEQAELLLSGGTITAPFDGVITSVSAEEGALVTAATPMMSLVDISGFRIEVNVDEVDIALVEEGQPAVLTLDALPGTELSGHVANIAPVSSLDGGIVVYTVEIEVDSTEAGLRAGMSANAEITTKHKENALLVPNRAIRVNHEDGTYHVEKMAGGEIVDVEIVPGMRNESVSEITQGLKEGDELIIRTQSFQERVRKAFEGGG